MYNYLIPRIEALLKTIDSVKGVYPYPLPGNPKESPTVVFVPDTLDNSFEDTASDFKIYRFKLWIVISIAGTDEKKVFGSILPKVMDDVIQTFDQNWNGGSVDGHRIWQIVNTANWQYIVNDSGKTAIAELNLEVRTTTNS